MIASLQQGAHIPITPEQGNNQKPSTVDKWEVKVHSIGRDYLSWVLTPPNYKRGYPRLPSSPRFLHNSPFPYLFFLFVVFYF
jgi:hypothetical protein